MAAFAINPERVAAFASGGAERRRQEERVTLVRGTAAPPLDLAGVDTRAAGDAGRVAALHAALRAALEADPAPAQPPSP
jgi:hypothetical protein